MLYNARLLLEDVGQSLQHHQTLHVVLLSVGTTAAGVMKRHSVELPVHIRETDKRQGFS